MAAVSEGGGAVAIESLGNPRVGAISYEALQECSALREKQRREAALAWLREAPRDRPAATRM